MDILSRLVNKQVIVWLVLLLQVDLVQFLAELINDMF